MTRNDIINEMTRLLGESGNRRLALRIYQDLRKQGLIQSHGRLGLSVSPMLGLADWIAVTKHPRVRGPTY